MKPTFQISRSSRRSEALRPLDNHLSQAPMLDWSFRSSAPDLRGGTAPFHPGAQHMVRRPGFHTLSQTFFAKEANRESRFEGALFGIVVALAAWPIVLAAQAALALMK